MLSWETIIKSLNWTLILNVISFLLLVWLLRPFLQGFGLSLQGFGPPYPFLLELPSPIEPAQKRLKEKAAEEPNEE